ncbi:hypothetical protein RJ639_023349 [Escallonia herrerae]|uniref:Uncharacterized protein n=1 Tax=Escallonia herrerae TaxID=1293975 RepID=A0AA89ADE1_9ASTE|nr:hypothetical protein RJ639_023349 [Escallonia herrerae]
MEFAYVSGPRRELMVELVSTLETRLATHLLPCDLPPDVQYYQHQTGTAQATLHVRSGIQSSPGWRKKEFPVPKTPLFAPSVELLDILPGRANRPLHPESLRSDHPPPTTGRVFHPIWDDVSTSKAQHSSVPTSPHIDASSACKSNAMVSRHESRPLRVAGALSSASESRDLPPPPPQLLLLLGNPPCRTPRAARRTTSLGGSAQLVRHPGIPGLPRTYHCRHRGLWGR